MSDAEPDNPAKRQKLDNESSAATETGQKDIDFTEDVSEPDNRFAMNKYEDFVTPEEVEKLKEFKVLDEVKSNDEDSEDEDSEVSEKSEGVPEEEIEKMLDDELPEEMKVAHKPKEKRYITQQKIILEEKGVNQFDLLPLDWVMVRHVSGLPVFVHRPSRVATLAKPYSLGTGNTRRHEVPISAIPCLNYRKALEEEAKQKEIDRQIAEQIKTGSWKNNIDNPVGKTNVENDKEINKPNSTEQTATGESSDNTKDQNEANGVQEKATEQCPFKEGETPKEKESSETSKETEKTQDKEILTARPIVLPGGIVMPPPRVESVNTSWKTQHLKPEELNEYCRKLFKFKNVKIMQFQSWADRRKYTKARKTLQCPKLPEGTKVISIPANPLLQDEGSSTGGGRAKRDWVLNLDGRSYLSVFHEYVCRALQQQPIYVFKQLENSSSPYQATVSIGGMQYGVGRGSSKRLAKAAAARAAIRVLIPEMQAEGPENATTTQDTEPDLAFFEGVAVQDPRVPDFCAAACEPAPHALLRTCLLRNFGAGDRHIHTELKKLEHQKVELTMKVGKHTATVVCKNKKTAKQRAAQVILQALHPHVRSWGSLIRLYGSRSVKSCKEKKLEEQEITLLQDKARDNEPNYAVLEKLRQEMRRLKERDEAVVPIGTLVVKDDLPTHSGSNLNNVDL